MKRLLAITAILVMLLCGCSVICKNPQWVKADLDATITQLDAVVLAIMESPWPSDGIAVEINGVVFVVTKEMAASTVETGKMMLVGLRALYAQVCPEVAQVATAVAQADNLVKTDPAANFGFKMARLKGRLP